MSSCQRSDLHPNRLCEEAVGESQKDRLSGVLLGEGISLGEFACANG